jgi:hypothetical protein
MILDIIQITWPRRPLGSPSEKGHWCESKIRWCEKPMRFLRLCFFSPRSHALPVWGKLGETQLGFTCARLYSDTFQEGIRLKRCEVTESTRHLSILISTTRTAYIRWNSIRCFFWAWMTFNLADLKQNGRRELTDKDTGRSPTQKGIFECTRSAFSASFIYYFSQI